MRDQEWKMRNVLFELGIKMKPMLGAFFFIPISAIGSHCLLCFQLPNSCFQMIKGKVLE